MRPKRKFGQQKGKNRSHGNRKPKKKKKKPYYEDRPRLNRAGAKRGVGGEKKHDTKGEN